MISSQFAALRKSFDTYSQHTKSSEQVAIISRKDITKNQYKAYGLDVELSDNKKKILQAFKNSSGILNNNAEKSTEICQNKIQKMFSQQNKVVPSSVQINNKNKLHQLENIIEKQQPFSKISQVSTSLYKTGFKDSLTLSKSCNQMGLISTINFSNLKNTISDKDIQSFFRQMFETIGLCSEDDSKMQLEYLISSAYSNYVQMKSNGRWKLIKSYFQGQNNENEDHLNQSNNRSIIKKKSSVLIAQTAFQKKKVRVVEPQTLSELQRINSTLQKDLSNMISRLTKGFQIVRYNDESLRREQGTLLFSYDFRYVCWKNKKGANKIYSMSKYGGVSQGITQSENLKKLCLKNPSLDQTRIFSIMLGQNILDLQASSISQKEQIMFTIRQMKSFC